MSQFFFSCHMIYKWEVLKMEPQDYVCCKKEKKCEMKCSTIIIGILAIITAFFLGLLISATTILTALTTLGITILFIVFAVLLLLTIIYKICNKIRR